MNTRKWFGILAGIVLLCGACKDKQYLVGYYSYEEYQKECKWDSFVDNDYTPRGKWADSLATLDLKDDLDVQLWVGSYCPDSKKWVPRFYGMKDDLPIGEVAIISVDTTKKDEKGLYEAARIEKIPTFIFLKGDREVGRITERPKGRIEKHLFRILKNCE